LKKKSEKSLLIQKKALPLQPHLEKCTLLKGFLRK